MLSDQLQQLGLGQNEGKVYLAALELGESSMQRIAKKAGVKRTTAYGVLETLKEKGLMSVAKRNRKTVYYAEDPRKFRDALEQRVHTLDAMIPQLLSITNLLDKKPKIKYYEGKEELKEIYKDTFNYPGQEYLLWMSETSFYQFDRPFWYDYYMPRQVESKISVRTIVPDSKITRTFKTKDKQFLRQTRIEESSQLTIEAEIMLYGGKSIAVLSFDELVGLILESKKLHNTLKGIFELHWKSLER